MTRLRALRLTVPVVMTCLALIVGLAISGSLAEASAVPHCSHYAGSGVPPGSGIPPWGFHASQVFRQGGSGYAHGWGNINLDANLISGKICQDVSGRGRPASMIAVRLGPRIIYHTHHAEKWGYPGNLIRAPIKVIASTDPKCKLGTRGYVTMYASYNGVRSDSIEFFLAAACRDQNHLYHGPQVDAQVPPL